MFSAEGKECFNGVGVSSEGSRGPRTIKSFINRLFEGSGPFLGQGNLKTGWQGGEGRGFKFLGLEMNLMSFVHMRQHGGCRCGDEFVLQRHDCRMRETYGAIELKSRKARRG